MDELEGLLAATLGPVDSQRRAAEDRLHECRKVPGFTRALAVMTLELSRPVELRQLAAVLLKRFLSPEFVDSVSDAEIEEIKALVLHGLSDPSSKIRTAVSMVISQLVWTSKRRGEDWPALLRRLYQGMTGSDEQDVYGCCKCLYMVCEELPHSDAYSLLPTIAPTIFTIVSNNNLRCRTRMRAASVMLSCFQAATLEKGEEHGTRRVREAITGIIGSWLQICQQVFSTLAVEAPDFRLPIELMRTLVVLLREFAKCLKDQVGGLFHAICNFLKDASGVYERDVLRSSSDGTEGEASGVTSDSESVSLEPMVIESLDFLKAVLDCHIAKVAKLMLRAARSPDFLLLMVRYMQMKDVDALKAEHDANEYMADDEEPHRTTARNSAMDLFEDLAELSPIEAVSSLVATVRAVAQDMKAGQGGSDPCRLQEACLFALGAVSAPVMEEYRRVEGLSVKRAEKGKALNSTGLKPLVLEAISNACRSESVLLRLRGVRLAVHYAEFIDPPAKIQLTMGCIEAMSPTQPLVFRLFSCRALSVLLPSLQQSSTPQLSSQLQQLLPVLLDHVGPLLGLTTSDTIHQIAETVSAAARVLRTQVNPVSPAITDSSEPAKVMAMVLEIWARYPADSLTVEMSCEALLALLEGCADELSLASLSFALFGKMAKVVEAGLATYGVCVLSTAIEVLEQTVRKVAPSFRRDPEAAPTEIEVELREFFPLLIQFLLASAGDKELLVRGVALLRVMVRCCPLEKWSYPAWGLTGLDLLVDFLGKAFAQEESVRVVGVLISEIISHRGQYIHEKVIENMLTAVLSRLRTAESEELAQQLILIFVRLALVSMTAVVTFLKRHEVVEHFLKGWLSMHNKLGSMKLAKISGVALLRLLEYAVTVDRSLCDLKVQHPEGLGDAASAGQLDPLVPCLLRMVVGTVIDIQEAFEKGAEAGSEAATDYLDPSLYTLEDGEEDEEGEDEDEDEAGLEAAMGGGGREKGGMDGASPFLDEDSLVLDESGRRGQLAAEHLKALGRESGRGGRLAMGEALRMMGSAASSPFVDLEAYQGLVMDAADDEADDSDADQAGDPLAAIDLKDALTEFVLKSRWMCGGDLGALLSCMGPNEKQFLQAVLEVESQ